MENLNEKRLRLEAEVEKYKDGGPCALARLAWDCIRDECKQNYAPGDAQAIVEFAAYQSLNVLETVAEVLQVDRAAVLAFVGQNVLREGDFRQARWAPDVVAECRNLFSTSDDASRYEYETKVGETLMGMTNLSYRERTARLEMAKDDLIGVLKKITKTT